MDQNFWHSRWQANEIGFHQAEVNPQLQRYWREIQALAGGRVFVPLCGKSHDMLWLAAQGHRVLGVEISPIAVRDFFKENDLAAVTRPGADFQEHHSDEITLLQGDFFALSPGQLKEVAAVYDRASLIALPPSLRRRYVEQMASILPSGMPILLLTLDYPQAEMDGPPFSVPDAEVRSLFAGGFHIESLGAQDVLARYPQFQARGLSRLQELAYRLVRR
jgi:thiopurine S-methyltransferase